MTKVQVDTKIVRRVSCEVDIPADEILDLLERLAGTTFPEGVYLPGMTIQRNHGLTITLKWTEE